MQELCKDGSLSLEQWIEMAATLGVDGLEFYSGFLDLQKPSELGALPAPGRGPRAWPCR